MEKTSTFPQTPAGSGISGATSGSSAMDATTAALQSGIDKTAEPAHQTVDRLSSAAHKTVDRLADGATQVADRFSEQTRRVTEAPKEAVEFTRSWVQEKPLEAVGVALAIGFVFGRLTAR